MMNRNSVIERKKMVLAMEYIVRNMNDEDDFMNWLLGGVADGEIPYGTDDIDYIDECYIDDKNFKELMGCFLRRMSNAIKQGLYCNGVLATKED